MGGLQGNLFGSAENKIGFSSCYMYVPRVFLGSHSTLSVKLDL